MDKNWILNLDGYLLSLRRLSRNKCDYWADTFEIHGDLRESFSNHIAKLDVTLKDDFSIGLKEIDSLLFEHMKVNIIEIDDSLLRQFVWDVIEFIELSYQLAQPDVDPMTNKESIAINANSEFHGDFVYLVIPTGKLGILIGLAARA